MATSAKLGIETGPAYRLEPTDILTPKELAERLKVPLSWVYKQTAKSETVNAIPVLRVGNYLRFDWNAVSRWMRRGS